MSGKKAKQKRREIREFFRPLRPIADQATEEVNSNPHLFMKWATMATILKRLHPEIPLEQLLPNSLKNTIQTYRPELLTETSPECSK